MFCLFSSWHYTYRNRACQTSISFFYESDRTDRLQGEVFTTYLDSVQIFILCILMEKNPASFFNVC